MNNYKKLLNTYKPDFGTFNLPNDETELRTLLQDVNTIKENVSDDSYFLCRISEYLDITNNNLVKIIHDVISLTKGMSTFHPINFSKQYKYFNQHKIDTYMKKDDDINITNTDIHVHFRLALLNAIINQINIFCFLQ